jgi:hypothetical protein
MLTWGGVEELKHFLPRILDIVATGDFGYPDLEVVFSKLRHADWRRWPQQEVRSVEQYLAAKWRTVLGVFPAPRLATAVRGGHDADTVLCAIGQAVDSIQPSLTAWLEAEGEAPARHLAAFLYDNARCLTLSAGLRNAFWSDRPVQCQQVRGWVREPAVLDRLNRAFFCASNDEAEEAFSTAVMVAEAVARK